MNKKKQILCFVDFGFSSIRLSLCSVVNYKLNEIIFFEEKKIPLPTYRLQSVVMQESNFDTLLELIDVAEKKAKTNITEIIFLFKDRSIQHVQEKQVICFSHNQKIFYSHLEKLSHKTIESFCKKYGKNYDITDMIQDYFLTDGYMVSNPYKITCKTIEMTSSIFAIKKITTKFFCEYLEKCKIHARHFLSPSCCLSFLLKHDAYQKGIFLIIDIGACNVEFSVLKDGYIILSRVLCIGGFDITRDIFSLMKIYLQDAEDLKKIISKKNYNTIIKKLSSMQSFADMTMSQIEQIILQITEIADARFNEIATFVLEDINKDFKYINFNKILLFGDGSKYKNAEKIMADTFNTKVEVIKPNIIENNYIFKNIFDSYDDKERGKILNQKNIPLLGAIAVYISNMQKYDNLKKGFFYKVPKKISCLLKELIY